MNTLNIICNILRDFGFAYLIFLGTMDITEDRTVALVVSIVFFVIALAIHFKGYRRPLT